MKIWTTAHQIAIAVLALCASSNQYRLNVPKVLLPYWITTPVNFTLEVSDPSGGCFTWRSSRPEVATVSAVTSNDKECSEKAIVSAVSKTHHRVTTVVFAEEQITGTVLRCDVIVDAIFAIEIITTTRELYLEDSPEIFIVQAKNDQKDTFSELGGIAFEWTLHTDKEVDPENRVDAQEILRIIPFSDSKYQYYPGIEQLEKRGSRGYMCMVEGIQTGSAFVQVRLKDEPYQSIAAESIGILVVANLMLAPPDDLYVPVHAVVHYRVELIKQGRAEEIAMPSQQYYLDVEQTSVCSLNADTSDVTALQLGLTDIVLKHRNVKTRQSFREPRASIHVVQPHQLGFAVLRSRTWVFEVKRVYEVCVEVFDRNGRKLFIASNMRIETSIPSDYFQVLSAADNGTYFVLRPVKAGRAELNSIFTGLLKGTTLVKLEPAVIGTQTVEIYDAIRIVPSVLAFPWDPISHGKYNYRMEAFGGSGNYTWSTDNAKVALVSELSGQLTTIDEGVSKVFAADLRNRLHRAEAEVYVLPVSRIRFSPHHLEAEVGTTLTLSVAVYGRMRRPGKQEEEVQFLDCRHLAIKVEMADHVSWEVARSGEASSSAVGDGCTSVTLRAIQAGDTKVRILYKTESTVLTDEVTVSAFEPLQVIGPTPLLLAIGSTWTVAVVGGPRPWLLEPLRFISEDPKRKLLITCKAIGEVLVNIKIGNEPTTTNPHPKVVTAEFSLSCAVPSRLHVEPQAERSIDHIPVCPFTADGVQAYHALCTEPFNVVLTAWDNQGRRFNNASSLLVSWTVSDAELAHVVAAGRSISSGEAVDQAYSDVLQTINPAGKPGLVTLRAEIKHYQDAFCSRGGCKKPLPVEVPPATSVDFILANLATINPVEVSVFNHPSSKATLVITNGSGHFHLASVTDLANVSFTTTGAALQILPKREGAFTLQIIDLCMKPARPLEAQVYVSDISKIELHGPDKIEKGSEIVLIAKILDDHGHVLPEAYSNVKSVKADDSAVLSVVRTETSGGNLLIVVRAMASGSTAVRVFAEGSDGKTMVSKPHMVQVYAPFRLLPRNITLLTGSVVQVSVSGGPQPTPTLQYTVSVSNVAKVSDVGLVEATALGSAQLLGRMYDVDAVTGQQVLIGEDVVHITVTSLTGIRIHLPTTRLYVGSELPIYAVGLTDQETPFMFGSAQYPLQFHWEADSKAATLTSVYHRAGIKDSTDGVFAKRLLAQHAGTITIKLVVKAHPKSQHHLAQSQLSHSVTVQIIDKFAFSLPTPLCSDVILMSPDSQLALSTNKDSANVQRTFLSNNGHQQPRNIFFDNATNMLRAGRLTGHAAIQLSTFTPDLGYNETVSILVEVKPISYMMINARTQFAADGTLAKLPVGFSVQFDVSYHDAFGRQFQAVNSDLTVRLNRNDLAQAGALNSKNESFIVHLRQLGSTVLSVSDELNAKLLDFVHLHVGTVLHPQGTFGVGDIVCLHSPIAVSTTMPRWTSENTALVAVDNDGVVIVKRAGLCKIFYTLGASQVTSIELNMEPLSELVFQTHEWKYVANVTEYQELRFPLLLKHVASQTTNVHSCSAHLNGTSALLERALPNVECGVDWSSATDVSIKFLFSSALLFDKALGSYVCSVKMLPFGLNTDALSRIDADLVVSVRADSQAVSATLSLPFYPDIYVHQDSVELNDLELSQVVCSVSIAPRLVAHLRVIPTIRDIVMVRPLEKDALDDRKYSFLVLLNRHAHALWNEDLSTAALVLRNDITGAEKRIALKIRLLGKPPLGVTTSLSCARPWYSLALSEISWMSALFMVSALVTCLCLVLGYRWLVGQTSGAQAVYPEYGPNPPSTGFIQWRSHMGRGDSTPTRGSPYLWSVSPMQNGSPPPAVYRSPGGLPTKRSSPAGS